MKPSELFFTIIFLWVGFLLPSSCTGGKKFNDSKSEKIFAGCTPGDSLIKAMLSIPNEINVDFIQWELKLNQPNEDRSSFLLNIVFGESQPNTLGFKKEHKKTFEGEFTCSEKTIADHQAGIYHLKSPQFQQQISMVRINDHLLHVLTSRNQLMTGNGGYSYTLNYTGPIQDRDSSLITYSAFTNAPPLQAIYEGRTPCQDIAAEYEMNANAECFKLKWKLILNRDSVSHQPTTYVMRKIVDNIPREVEGKWNVIRGTLSHPKVLIYQLDPDIPGKSILLLAADENILFFLHKDTSLFVGNENFSYTLNRRMK